MLQMGRLGMGFCQERVTAVFTLQFYMHKYEHTLVVWDAAWYPQQLCSFPFLIVESKKPNQRHLQYVSNLKSSKNRRDVFSLSNFQAVQSSVTA